jgi:hypothetical protein
MALPFRSYARLHAVSRQGDAAQSYVVIRYVTIPTMIIVCLEFSGAMHRSRSAWHVTLTCEVVRWLLMHMTLDVDSLMHAWI